MRAYINMVVKKRCSIMSVTSVTSSWVRWSAPTSREPSVCPVANRCRGRLRWLVVFFNGGSRTSHLILEVELRLVGERRKQHGGKSGHGGQAHTLLAWVSLGMRDPLEKWAWQIKRPVFWVSNTQPLPPVLVLHVGVQAQSKLLSAPRTNKTL